MQPVHVPCPSCGALNRADPARLAQATCGKCRAPLAVDHPLELTAATFQSQVTRSGLPVVVDFWAPWCGPCRSMAPAFAEAARQLAPSFRFAKVNTEAEPALGQTFQVRSIPTMILFRDGQEVKRISGALSLPQLLSWCSSGSGS